MSSGRGKRGRGSSVREFEDETEDEGGTTRERRRRGRTGTVRLPLKEMPAEWRHPDKRAHRVSHAFGMNHLKHVTYTVTYQPSTHLHGLSLA